MLFPASQPFKLKFSAPLLPEVPIRKIHPASPDRKHDPATEGVALFSGRGAGKAPQLQLDLGRGLLLL